MKRKRKSEQVDDTQTCDLILTDAQGRSVRAHKAILIDKSDYFAKILGEKDTNVLQFDENYLVELIHYLYKHEAKDQRRPDEHSVVVSEDDWQSDIIDGDVGILMQLLALSKKYHFSQLYKNLLVEINYKTRPSTALTIYVNARELGISELQDSSRIAILSWLPQVQQSDAFLSLSEECIRDIFDSEACDVDNNCKLNALSVWWSNNKDADMTSLWVKLITCSNT